MAKKDIELQSFEIKDFGGISNDAPVVLYVGDAYKEGKNIAMVSGDEGRGKSSWLTAIQGLFQCNLGVKEENFANNKTGKINASFEFMFEEEKYRVTWTKSAFKLQRRELNKLTDKEGWRDETSPSATLKKVIGYVGVTPMNLKTKDGKKQVEEIRKALNATPEIEAEESKVLAAFEKAKTARTEANKDYERLKKALEASELYLNWEASEKAYEEEKKSDTEKAKVQELSKKKDLLAAADIKQKGFVRDIANTEEEIEELKAKLQEKELALMHLRDNKGVADKYLEENKSVIEEYNVAQESYMGIERYLAERNQWLTVKRMKSEMDQFQDAVITLDGQKDELKGSLLELGKKGMPQIEGLEVVTSDAIEGQAVGVYLDGRNVYQLSESELWTLFLKIWESQKVNFVFVENISSLGSHAVGTLNELAAKGVKIFASKMVRGGEFTITMTDKIED